MDQDLSSKTEEELKSLILDRDHYGADERQDAIEELERREEELKSSDSDTTANTEDDNLPKLYSKVAIMLFAIIFSPVFGSTLLGINLRRLGKIERSAFVMAFGAIFSVAEIALIIYVEVTAMMALVFNFAGAFLLTEIFWNKYIGKDFQYKKQNTIIAALISIIATTAIVLLTMR